MSAIIASYSAGLGIQFNLALPCLACLTSATAVGQGLCRKGQGLCRRHIDRQRSQKSTAELLEEEHC